MAADLHIHVFAEGELTEEDYRGFFSNTLGTKWFNPQPYEKNRYDELWHKFSMTDNVWVGEVSWLKAALFDDEDTFIPDPVSQVHEIIGHDWPVIDEELIEKIEKAMYKENKTAYMLSSADDVINFLRKNMGKMAFTISW